MDALLQFGGLPGGMELLIVLVILTFLLVPVAVVVVGVWYFVNRESSGSVDRDRVEREHTERGRVAELESELEDLQAELEDLRSRVEDDENQ